MRRRIVRSQLTAFVLSLIVPTGPVAAVTFRGVEFQQGASSFADAVASCQPVVTNGVSLSAQVQHPEQALGPPDHVTGSTPRFVSLGNGGSITLRFVDNALTGSGNSTKDLWIFEIGPAVEDTDVAISQDSVTWNGVGRVFGSTSGIDTDSFGFGPSARFFFVRLTDVRRLDFSADDTAGADIDAVGAISTVLVDTTAPAVTVPDNHTAEATSAVGALVSYAASAIDRVDGLLTPACSPAPGSLFALGTTTVTCTATDDAGNTADGSFAVTVSRPAYGICPLFDQSKAVRAGAVKPIRVQLCDAAGTNLSTPDPGLHAVGLRRVAGSASAEVEDPGRANSPDADFRYDGGSSIFNLDTGDLSTGTRELQFIIAGDSRVYGVRFDVR